ncbi:MAG: ABC transporter permease subunit, partial [candidate division NC10 bacterium]
SILERVKNSTGATAVAFEKVNATAGDALGDAKANLQDLMISIGNVLLPLVAKLADMVKTAAGAFSAFAEQHPILAKIGVVLAAVTAGVLLLGGAGLVMAGQIVTAMAAINISTGGLLLAMCLSNVRKGGGLLRSLMIIPWAVPAVVSGLIWKWMFSPDFGVISDLLMKAHLIAKPLSIYSDPSLAMWGVIIADSWTRIPFMGIILLAAILSIPDQIHEAARVDGADTVKRFLYVTLPMIRGPLLIGLMITTIFSFRTIDLIIPLTAGGPGRATYVLGYYIWDQITKSLNFGLGAAAGVVLFLITALITVIFVYLLREK